jgi:hypothetical protein
MAVGRFPWRGEILAWPRTPAAAFRFIGTRDLIGSAFAGINASMPRRSRGKASSTGLLHQ